MVFDSRDHQADALFAVAQLVLRSRDPLEAGRDDDPTQDYDEQRDAAADQSDRRSGALCFVPERLAVLKQAVLSRDGSIDELVDAAHGIGTDICLNDLLGGVKSLGLLGVYGAFQLITLDIDPMLQKRPSTLLGIVRRELLQSCQKFWDRLHTLRVGIEIRRISGNQEAALNSLCILDRPLERLRRRNHLYGVGDEVLASPQLRDIAGDLVNLQPDEHECRYEDRCQSLPEGFGNV